MKFRDMFKNFCGMCWGCFIFCSLVFTALVVAGIWALVSGVLLLGLGVLGLAALYGSVMMIIMVGQARFHNAQGVACFEI